MTKLGNVDDIGFDHVFMVKADGTVDDSDHRMHAPDLYDEELQGDPAWQFFTVGYSGQYGYSGPIMHNSEYIGGRLERDILATPGYYAVIAAYWTPEENENTDEEGSEIEGWAVVYRPLESVQS